LNIDTIKNEETHDPETMTDMIKNEVANVPAASSDPSLEYLLSHVLSQYQQTTGVPAGYIARGLNIHDGIPSVRLNPKTHNQSGCPRNFQGFLGSARLHGMMDAKEALPWYARARMRYSCSTLTAGFVKFLVSELDKAGISELKSSTTGDHIRLSDLEIYTLLFCPDKQHAIEMAYPLIGNRLDIVEMKAFSGLCSHNMLRCRRTEIIVDPTLGQFTGCLQAFVFRNIDEYVPQIPGEVIRTYLAPQEAIEEQLVRDFHLAKMSKRPESTPIRVAKSIVRCFQAEEDFCWNCHGIASTSTSPLMRCTRCKQALYCGKHCQILHWQTHKTDCHRQEATLA
jgi:hypothetical protein